MQSSTHNGIHRRTDGFVSYEGFIDACSILVSGHHGAPRGGRMSFNLFGERDSRYLIISTNITKDEVIQASASAIQSHSHDWDDLTEEIGTHDEVYLAFQAPAWLRHWPLTLDQAAIHHAYTPEQHASVQYDVLHSQSYQVPVLYFHYRHPADAQSGLDAVYGALVPKDQASEMRGMGVMGAISMGVGNAFTLPGLC